MRRLCQHVFAGDQLGDADTEAVVEDEDFAAGDRHSETVQMELKDGEVRIDAYFVEIMTDDGVTGRCGPFRAPCAWFVANQLRPILLGEDPLALAYGNSGVVNTYVFMYRTTRPRPDLDDVAHLAAEAEVLRQKHRANGHDHGPVIELRSGERHIAAQAGVEALYQAGAEFYQRGRLLIRVGEMQARSTSGDVIMVPGIIKITPAMLDRALGQSAIWQRFDAKTQQPRRVDPPKEVVGQILDMVGEWPFPPLAGIVGCPTLRPDGSILADEGYDPATGLWTVGSTIGATAPNNTAVLHITAIVGPGAEDGQPPLRMDQVKTVGHVAAGGERSSADCDIGYFLPL
jgi:hypothetical protein